MAFDSGAIFGLGFVVDLDFVALDLANLDLANLDLADLDLADLDLADLDLADLDLAAGRDVAFALRLTVAALDLVFGLLLGLALFLAFGAAFVLDPVFLVATMGVLNCKIEWP